MVAIAFFVIAKFGAYCTFCAFAPRWFSFTDTSPVLFGLRWGAARLLIGIAAAFPIGFLYVVTVEAGFPLVASYAISFVPMRYLEWFLLFKLMAKGRGLAFDVRANNWILLGLSVSVALDLIALAAEYFGIASFKFFC